MTRPYPITCPHCGQLFRYSCQHSTVLARSTKDEHDRVLAEQERKLELALLRAEYAGARNPKAIAAIARHAAVNGRSFSWAGSPVEVLL